MNHQLIQKTTQRERATDPLVIRTDRWLRQLSGRRAPADFAPRILAELARRAQLAWYRRPWTDWPEILRWLSMLVLGAAVAGALRLLETGSQVAVAKAPPALIAAGDVPLYLQFAESTSRAVFSLLQSLPALWLMAGACVVGAVAAGTLGLGTAAWRLVRSSSH